MIASAVVHFPPDHQRPIHPIGRRIPRLPLRQQDDGPTVPLLTLAYRLGVDGSYHDIAMHRTNDAIHDQQVAGLDARTLHPVALNLQQVRIAQISKRSSMETCFSMWPAPSDGNHRGLRKEYRGSFSSTAEGRPGILILTMRIAASSMTGRVMESGAYPVGWAVMPGTL
jgi:hypothetical protein